ncbi:hypothetical protein [Alteribacter aurantiacus]|uniref:hypothetical protein n=1 Tax=Alteribacter aurantiacus TaxID=254410 RepID=UPI000408669D|nr:hypothetical protein [Alteribacter aurantiacus]
MIPKHLTVYKKKPLIFTVRLDKCRDWLGHGYTRDSWHYLSYGVNGALKGGKESRLQKYYSLFKPKTLEEALFFHQKEHPFLPDRPPHHSELP